MGGWRRFPPAGEDRSSAGEEDKACVPGSSESEVLGATRAEGGVNCWLSDRRLGQVETCARDLSAAGRRGGGPGGKGGGGSAARGPSRLRVLPAAAGRAEPRGTGGPPSTAIPGGAAAPRKRPAPSASAPPPARLAGPRFPRSSARWTPLKRSCRRCQGPRLPRSPAAGVEDGTLHPPRLGDRARGAEPPASAVRACCLWALPTAAADPPPGGGA